MLVTSEDVRREYVIKDNGRLYPRIDGENNTRNLRKKPFYNTLEDGYINPARMSVFSVAENKLVTISRKNFLALYYGFELKKDELIHFIDGDKSNFRRLNLKVTSTGLIRAKFSQKNHVSKTGYRNVYGSLRGGYVVSIQKDGEKHVKYFPILSSAVMHANEKRKELFGEFAFQEEIRPMDITNEKGEVVSSDVDVYTSRADSYKAYKESKKSPAAPKKTPLMPSTSMTAKIKNRTEELEKQPLSEKELYNITKEQRERDKFKEIATMVISAEANVVQEALDKLSVGALTELSEVVTITLAAKIDALRDEKFAKIRQELDLLGATYVIGVSGRVYESN